ncbi:MAG: type II secretion system protein M [Leptospiraceae bacterium]|nr:type II secretion system protein M [Leptospiraceae bacterium]
MMLEKLNERERMFVLVGGIVALALILFVGLKTILDHRSKLRAEVQNARRSLVQIREMSQLIQRLPSGQQAPGQDQVKNQLRQLMNSIGLEHTNLDANERKEGKGQEKIEIKITFNSVKLVDIFKFLYEVEVNGQVPARVEMLRLQRPFSNKEVYDVRMDLFVLRPDQGGSR